LHQHLYLKIARNTVYLLLSNVVANGCLFATNIILANRLSTEVYGMVTLVISISSICVLLADLGVSTGATKSLAEALDAHTHERVENILSGSFRVTLLAAALFTLLCFVTASPLGAFLGHREIIPYLKMAALWVVPYSFMRNSLAVFQGFQDMKYSFWANFAREPLRLIALFVILLIGVSIERIVIGWTVAVYIGLLFFILFLVRFLSQRGCRFHLRSRGNERGFMRYSLYLYLPFLGVWAMPYLLNALVGKFGGLNEVSYFTVAFSLTTLPFFLFLPLSNALLPAFSETFGKEGLDRKPITLLFAYVGVANFFLFSILCFWRHFVLTRIYGADYEAAQTLLVILSFAVFFESFKIVADPLLKGTRYARLSMFIEIFRFAIILTGGVALIHFWSVTGASIILLIVYFLSSLLKLSLIERHLNIRCLNTFYYSFSWALLLIVSLLLHVPFFVFLLLAILLMIMERILTWQSIRSLWVLLRMKGEFHGAEA
jgi:O-antigen/teichoic acid export membrane protein